MTIGHLLVLDHAGMGDSLIGYGAGWQVYLDGPLATELGEQVTGAWDEQYQAALPIWRDRARAPGPS